MELLLIRHALPVRRELVEGRADPELAEAGHHQAEHLAQYLTAERIDAVYASPLRRARQTAAPLAAAHGVEIVIEDGVAEYDRDSNEYVPMEELKATNDPRWQAMLAGEWTNPDVPRDEWETNVVTTVERLIDAHPSQRIAVVCHGGVLSAYLGWVLKVPDRQAFFYPNYTSIHRVAAARSGERSILTINETAHLRGTGLHLGLFNG
jgi:2,3-bisphosphoglycerate-dependent phosphoglycerate mutase